jgi:hypothetical protein
MMVANVNITFLMKKYSGLIKELKKLNVHRDEVISDLSITVLICKKDFNPKIGKSFEKYLYTAIENNLQRKIFAIKMKNATEYQIHDGMQCKVTSELDQIASEVPEIMDYILQRISEKDIISMHGEIGAKALVDVEPYL